MIRFYSNGIMKKVLKNPNEIISHFNGMITEMRDIDIYYRTNPQEIWNIDKQDMSMKKYVSIIDNNSANQACNIKLYHLKQIYLNELKYDKIHYNKVLYCQIISESIVQIAGLIHVLIQDINGDIIRFELGNYISPDIKISDIKNLNKGVKLIIKEPYIKYDERMNDCCIKLDNPSTNLVNLTEMGIDEYNHDILRHMNIEEINRDFSSIDSILDDIESLYWKGKYNESLLKCQQRMIEINGGFHNNLIPLIKQFILLWNLVSQNLVILHPNTSTTKKITK